MADLTPEILPLPQRLSLAYAPAKSRDAALTLLLLDNRLASIIRDRGELMIAQIKLAWWRDRLRENPDMWPKGEPLLERLRLWPADLSALVPLVDGWEQLLADELTPAGIEEFASGRASGWIALSDREDAQRQIGNAARYWALADLTLNLGTGDEAELVRAMAEGAPPNHGILPRKHRPLAVLCALSARALSQGRPDLLDGAGAAFLALRIGLIGR